jgi:hypothetical protein
VTPAGCLCSKEDCGKRLQELILLDREVEERYEAFMGLLGRYDCNNNYSVKWQCEQCQVRRRFVIVWSCVWVRAVVLYLYCHNCHNCTVTDCIPITGARSLESFDFLFYYRLVNGLLLTFYFIVHSERTWSTNDHKWFSEPCKQARKVKRRL